MALDAGQFFANVEDAFERLALPRCFVQGIVMSGIEG